MGNPDAWHASPELAALAELPETTIFPLDVTDSRSVHELASRIGAKVEILVNNGYHLRPGGIRGRKDVNTPRAEMDVNYFGLLRLARGIRSRCCASAARTGRFGACAWVNVLSIYALVNNPAFATYSASLAAAHSLSQCLRTDLQEGGVRVVNVFPGPLEDEWQATAAAAEAHPGGTRERGGESARGRRGRRLPRSGGAGDQRAAAGESEGSRTGAVAVNTVAEAERGIVADADAAGAPPALDRSEAAAPPHPDAAATLSRFLTDLVAGRIRVVDLTETLEPGFPTIVLPPELGQCWPFRLEEISRYDERGPGLVLEQLLVRGAHRDPLRRPDPLGVRQGPAEQRDRYHPGPELHRGEPACSTARGRVRGRTRTSCSRSTS